MPERGQLTRPMMRGCARFHADQTRLERPKIGDHAAAPQPPANDDVSIGVDAVDLEPVFGEIQTAGGNLHGGRLCSLWRSQTTTLWHIAAWSGGRPPHQEFNAVASAAPDSASRIPSHGKIATPEIRRARK